jgi:hypothetical protein
MRTPIKTGIIHLYLIPIAFLRVFFNLMML